LEKIMKMKPKDMGDNDVGLEIGEGYVMLGVKVEMPLDSGNITVVRCVELTPEKATELGQKLLRYGEIARKIAPATALLVEGPS